MGSFSVTKTAFAGYRLLAAKPSVAFWWFVFALGVILIQMVAAVVMAGPQLAALQDMRAAGQTDPASMMAVTRGLGPYYLFSMLYPWLVGAVTLGAATRAVLTPEKSAIGYLRFGGDEFRLLITTLVLIVIFILVLVVGVIIAAIFMAATGGSDLRLLRTNPGTFPASLAIKLLIGGLPGLAVVTWLSVKLSLAGAQTVGEQSIQIFGSWTLTRGIFWRALLTFVLGLIPVVAATVITFAFVYSGGSGSFTERANEMQAQATSFATAFDARHLAGFVLMAISRVLTMAAVIVPAAVIYQVVQPDEVSVFDDDDDDDDDD